MGRMPVPNSMVSTDCSHSIAKIWSEIFHKDGGRESNWISGEERILFLPIDNSPVTITPLFDAVESTKLKITFLNKLKTNRKKGSTPLTSHVMHVTLVMTWRKLIMVRFLRILQILMCGLFLACVCACLCACDLWDDPN
jgi:hypothetical protein